MAISHIAVAVAGYMTCSSLMLIVNKVAVLHLPAASVVLLSQLVFATLACRAAKQFGLADVEALTADRVRQFWTVPAAFLLTIWSNMKILQNANVDTFVVFRSSTPLLVSVADFVFLQKELPTAKSGLALVAVLAGATGYVATDKGFNVHAYLWVALWFTIFIFDQTYIKHKVDTVDITVWTQVYYTNALAAVPLALLLCFQYVTGQLEPEAWTATSLYWLLASCCMGVGISYFSFWTRGAVSATCFTVIGNVCKLLTIFVNVIMWDKHASPAGLAWLTCAMLAAFAYSQAPVRQNETAWAHLRRRLACGEKIDPAVTLVCEKKGTGNVAMKQKLDVQAGV